ncbi:MAG: glutathione S-transferase N-terminal domain-containing protein [Solirubrobacterales bacterium]
MTLYVTKDCRTCSLVQDSLDEVAIAHKTVVLPDHETSDRLPEGTQAPVLVDDDKVIQGSTDIFAYIDELWKLRADWLKYQSDTCYID